MNTPTPAAAATADAAARKFQAAEFKRRFRNPFHLEGRES